jgi:hypothetical protein
VLDDKDFNIGSRISRLETIVESISSSVLKIEGKLDSTNKINWAPIAIGVTIFFTVAGSVSTIYNARISTLNTVVEQHAEKLVELEKGAVERELKIQRHGEKILQTESEHDDLERRVLDLERRR